jgi:hypothetical protein
VHSKPLKILVFGLLLVFYGSFLVSESSLPGAMDLPREISNGQMVLHGQFDVLTRNVYSYTEPNQPFPNHHWLSGVAFYLSRTAVGWSGLGVLKVILLLLTFSLLFHVALKRAGFWWVALFSVPAIFILTERTELRPEVFSYLFVAGFLWVLTDAQAHPEKNRVFWLIPLELAWANMHIFFPIGIMMTGGFLVEKLIRGDQQLKTKLLTKKLVWVLASLVAVVFVNPYGLKALFLNMREFNMAHDFPITSAEVTPLNETIRSGVNIPATAYKPAAAVLALSFVAVFMLRSKRKSAAASASRAAGDKTAGGGQPVLPNNFIFYLLGAAGSFAVGFKIIRGLPLFGLMFLPAISDNYPEIWSALKRKLKRIWPEFETYLGPVWAGGFILLLTGLILTMPPEQPGLGLTSTSESSALFFKQNGLKGPIFNDTDIGSYLIYELYPQEKVFSDNRFGDAYSRSFFADIYIPIIRDEDKWRPALEKYKFNALFLNHYDELEGFRGFMFKRIYDPAWAWVYADQTVIILVRNTPENQEVIKNFRITPDNFVQRLKPLSDSKDAKDQLAAADLFNLAGRTDLSVPAYLKYVSKWPSNGKVWFVMGKTELTIVEESKRNPYLAAIYLERAIKEGWRTWQTYSFLAMAYFRTDQIERAKAAVKEEARLSPKNEDLEAWDKVLGAVAEEKTEVRGSDSHKAPDR